MHIFVPFVAAPSHRHRIDQCFKKNINLKDIEFPPLLRKLVNKKLPLTAIVFLTLSYLSVQFDLLKTTFSLSVLRNADNDNAT